MGSADFKPEPFTEREAFLWSIEEAAYLAHPQWFNGLQVYVERGQFATSIRKMAARFGWSEKRVRGFVQRMSKREKWAQHRADGGAQAPTIITVRSYDKYQARKHGVDTWSDVDTGACGAHAGHAIDTEQEEESNNGKARVNKDLILLGVQPSEDMTVAAIQLWNDAALRTGWRQITPDLAPARLQKLHALLELEGIANWERAIQRAEESSWVGRFANAPAIWFRFDFIVRHDKFQGLLEGDFDEVPLKYQGSGWSDANLRTNPHFTTTNSEDDIF